MMTGLPFFQLEAWVASTNSVNFSELTIPEYIARKETGWKLFAFNGKKANVMVVTNDPLLTEELALKAASVYMSGDYIRIYVDLNNLTSKTTNGNPPPCH